MAERRRRFIKTGRRLRLSLSQCNTDRGQPVTLLQLGKLRIGQSLVSDRKSRIRSGISGPDSPPRRRHPASLPACRLCLAVVHKPPASPALFNTFPRAVKRSPPICRRYRRLLIFAGQAATPPGTGGPPDHRSVARPPSCASRSTNCSVGIMAW